jgi:hypothetical protein
MSPPQLHAQMLSITDSCDTACVRTGNSLPSMLDSKFIVELHEDALTDNLGHAKDLLRVYVCDPLYGHYTWYASSEPMRLLQDRCKKFEKINPGFRNFPFRGIEKSGQRSV